LARVNYEKAYSINPDLNFLLGTVLHYQMQECDWRNLDERIKQLEIEVEKLIFKWVGLWSSWNPRMISSPLSELFPTLAYVSTFFCFELGYKISFLSTRVTLNLLSTKL
jgi:hypothetical protein